MFWNTFYDYTENSNNNCIVNIKVKKYKKKYQKIILTEKNKTLKTQFKEQ